MQFRLGRSEGRPFQCPWIRHEEDLFAWVYCVMLFIWDGVTTLLNSSPEVTSLKK